MANRLLLFIVSVFAVIALLSAYIFFTGDRTGAEVKYGHTTQFAPNQQVSASCSDVCSQHTQCGSENGNNWIFAHTERPATKEHTTLIGENSTLTVMEVRPEPMTLYRDNTQRVGNVPFYRTSYQLTTGEQQQAWVPGWCLASE